MNFDIPLHIETNTPEARVIEAIVRRDHVSPEEAVRRVLRDMANEGKAGTSPANAGSKKPGELLFGPYSDQPELMRRIAESSMRARN